MVSTKQRRLSPEIMVGSTLLETFDFIWTLPTWSRWLESARECGRAPMRAHLLNKTSHEDHSWLTISRMRREQWCECVLKHVEHQPGVAGLCMMSNADLKEKQVDCEPDFIYRKFGTTAFPDYRLCIGKQTMNLISISLRQWIRMGPSCWDI